mgnify:FL=1
MNITCEVTVHHLTLTDEACAGYSTATRVSPPLRSRDHVEAMRAGLKDGTIDAIVTDHAPHAPEEKDVEFRYAPNGSAVWKPLWGSSLRNCTTRESSPSMKSSTK